MMSSGGKREGAGRKPAPISTKRDSTISFRVHSSTKKAIQDLRTQGVDVTAELEKLAEKLKKGH